MAKIAVLNNNMINMIAAGEVIERPASVVKEMLENSIDAGATKISVYVEEGGQKLVQITDNGCGISSEDIPTAFLPHATSKIADVNDLTAIKSMGFRGEALASIASVAKVKVVSRERESISAFSMTVDCGQVGDIEPCSSDYGTTFEVRDLFYKLPARRKFLRTVNTEMGHISEHFTRIALAHNSIEMSLTHNKRKLYHLPGGQNTLERIGTLLSRDIEDSLMHVSSEEKGMSIRGYISRPGISKVNNKNQYVFLNGRYIRDKFIAHAVKEAYRGFIEPNKYPIAFLFIEMPYDAYDVNVHPTKTEIRFDNSNFVHSQVLAVIREKLMGTNVEINASLPERNIDKAPLDEILTRVQDSREERVTDAMKSFFEHNKPAAQKQFDFGNSPRRSSAAGSGFGSGSGGFSSPRRVDAVRPSEPFNSDRSFDFASVDSSSEEKVSDSSTGNHPPVVSADASSDMSPYYQVHNTYIVSQTEQGFEIIDQHALHERIIYEQLYSRICGENAGNLESQRLLIPETIDVTDSEAELLEEHDDLLRQLGIIAEPFGPSTYAIQAFPILLGKVDASNFLREIVDILSEMGIKPEREKLIHHILDMASCKAAIKAGKKLSIDEIDHLLEERNQTPRCGRCPHGRPTSIQFTIKDLEKQFKRTGF